MTRTEHIASGVDLQSAANQPNSVAASQKGKLHSASESELLATQGEQSPETPQVNVFVMFNFMHQLGRAMGAHMFGIWSNIILGESLRMLLDDFSVCIDRQSRQSFLGPIQ